jgi:hypothetical protein
MALQTITPKHQDLRQITIEMSYYLTIGENPIQTIGEWIGLDRLLVQLWESRSIRPRVMFTEGRGMIGHIGFLLPETTRGGIIDVVEREKSLVWCL